jgi:hypothetical protein
MGDVFLRGKVEVGSLHHNLDRVTCFTPPGLCGGAPHVTVQCSTRRHAAGPRVLSHLRCLTGVCEGNASRPGRTLVLSWQLMT